MNRDNRFALPILLTAVLLFLAACSAPQPTATEPPIILTDTPPPLAPASAGITVAFEGDECIYRGPERVPAGRIPVVLDVKDQTAHELYGVGTLTVDEGHTLAELAAFLVDTDMPLWSHDHGFVEAAQGTIQEETIVLFEGPLYLACFTNSAARDQTAAAGVLGPIEIEPVSVLPRGSYAAQAGERVLILDEDGGFSFSAAGEVLSSGTFSIQGRELTWETDSKCDQGAGKATYTWTLENETLLFQGQGQDPCAERAMLLDGIPYYKKQ